MNHSIESVRLLLRRPSGRELDDLIAQLDDRDRSLLSRYDRFGDDAHTHVIVSRSSLSVVGALRCVIDRDEATFSYLIAPEHRNCGYATEALAAFVAALPSVVRRASAQLRSGNDASSRVLAKVGFQWVGEGRDLIDGRLERVELFSLERAGSTVLEG
jgi:RimJ/RimL family protein N-acetyltransferase